MVNVGMNRDFVVLALSTTLMLLAVTVILANSYYKGLEEKRHLIMFNEAEDQRRLQLNLSKLTNTLVSDINQDLDEIKKVLNISHNIPETQ